MAIDKAVSEAEMKIMDNKYADLDREELIEKLKESESANLIAVNELRNMKEKLTSYKLQYENFSQKIAEVVETHDMKKKAMLVILSDGVKAYSKLEAENKELKRLVEEHVHHDKLEDELMQLKMQLQEQDRKIEELEAAKTPTRRPNVFARIHNWFRVKFSSSSS